MDVHPGLMIFCPNDYGYFWQDNASCHHSAGIEQDWFEVHEKEFTLLR